MTTELLTTIAAVLATAVIAYHAGATSVRRARLKENRRSRERAQDAAMMRKIAAEVVLKKVKPDAHALPHGAKTYFGAPVEEAKRCDNYRLISELEERTQQHLKKLTERTDQAFARIGDVRRGLNGRLDACNDITIRLDRSIEKVAKAAIDAGAIQSKALQESRTEMASIREDMQDIRDSIMTSGMHSSLGSRMATMDNKMQAVQSRLNALEL